MNLTWVCVLVSLLACAKSLSEDQLLRFISLTKFDYEEFCSKSAEAKWKFINKPTNETRRLWETAANEYAVYKIKQVNETSAEKIETLHDSSLAYAYNIVIKPGDALLQSHDFHELVSFSSQAEISRLNGYYLTGTKKHFRQDVERQMGRTGKPEEKLASWSAWHKTFAPQSANFSESLQLAKKAANANGEESVEKYWEMLSGLDDGYQKAKDEWSKIWSVHNKLQKFVKQRLAKKYGFSAETDGIPAHLLGSLRGYDWTNLAMDAISYSDVVYAIRKNMWENEIVGESLYKEASTMGHIILKHRPQADFWNESEFRGQCPSHLLNLCHDGKMRVSTCSEASIGNFITAHKNVGKILVNQMSHDADPVLGIANRYSALEEGVAELFGVLSVSHAWLSSRGLISNTTDMEEARIVSMMITALDVLPRMAYYLAADTWRLDAIQNEKLKLSDLESSWWKNRLEYEGISASLPTFLDDDYITSNKPYLSKFLGTILGFQIYEYIMESTEIRYETLLPTLTQTHLQLPRMIRHGFGNSWTGVIKKYMQLNEINSDSLLLYFSTLEDYIGENEELSENFVAPEEQERELDTLQDIYRKKLSEPATTTSTTTTTAKPIRYKPRTSTTEPPKSGSQPKNATSSKDPEIPASNKTKENPIQTETAQPAGSENNEKTKPATSKAVWAVGSVLVATVIICIIAIIGRKRCRKAPKNRRYV